MYLKKINFLEMNISVGRYDDFVSSILSLTRYSPNSYVCVANVHMLIETHINKGFQTIVNSASIITPDGKPLTWGLKLLYGFKQDRVAGMDLLPDLLFEAQKQSIPVFFYGGTNETISQTQEFIASNYPALRCSGYYSPPFRPLSLEEEHDTVKMINESGAQLVFVSLGCPKQEIWMNNFSKRLNCVLIGIGGALPVLIGKQKRAPLWVQNFGLEWFFRFLQEPKRLFKRYAYTNSLFIVLLTKAVFVKIFHKII